MNVSPINLSFDTVTRIGERALEWCNYNIPPKLMKLTNTGKTVMLSGKWYQERPYVKEGPLTNAYIFSQIHFHWGSTDFDGSEHSIEGKKTAMEMHIVHFNAKYKSLEEAKNKVDGITVAAFFFQIDDEPNDSLNQVIGQLSLVSNAFTSVNIEPFSLDALNMELFMTNYFVYCGAVGRESTPHLIVWLIYPIPIAISQAQVAKFRELKTSNGDLMSSNCHKIQNIINQNGVFFLDQIIDRGHRRESSLFCLPSLRHISKISSLTMSEQNSHPIDDLEGGAHTKEITNTEFPLRTKVPSYMKPFQQGVNIQSLNRGEEVGSKNENEVETGLKYQRRWNKDPHQDDLRKAKETHILSRINSKGENGKELEITDYDSETSIGDAISSTTFRLSSKQEDNCTSCYQNAMHDSTEITNIVDLQHSDISLEEARGSTMKRY